MATVGYTTTPSTTYGAYGGSTNNLLVAKVTMPAAGIITSVSCYVAAKSGSGNTTARFCVWDSSGNLLGQTADITLTPGTGGRGGQGWVTGTLTSGLSVANGTVIYIGVWRHYSQSHEWTEDAGTVEYTVSGGDGNSTSPPASETFSSAGGNPGIYATYTPGSAYVRRSGAWSTLPQLQIRRSGAWVNATNVYVRRSGAWAQIQ